MSSRAIVAAILALGLLAPGTACARVCGAGDAQAAAAEPPPAPEAAMPCHAAPEPASPASRPPAPDPCGEGCQRCAGPWLSPDPGFASVPANGLGPVGVSPQAFGGIRVSGLPPRRHLRDGPPPARPPARRSVLRL